jgi:hypothetical protein
MHVAPPCTPSSSSQVACGDGSSYAHRSFDRSGYGVRRLCAPPEPEATSLVQTSCRPQPPFVDRRSLSDHGQLRMPSSVQLTLSAGDLPAYEAELAQHQTLLAWLRSSGPSYGLTTEPASLDAVQRETLEAIYPDSGDGPIQIDPPMSLAFPPLVIELSSSAGLKKTCANFVALASDPPQHRSKRSPHAPLSYLSNVGRRVFRVERDYIAQIGDVTRGDGSGGESICASISSTRGRSEAELTAGPLGLRRWRSLQRREGGPQDALCLRHRRDGQLGQELEHVAGPSALPALLPTVRRFADRTRAPDLSSSSRSPRRQPSSPSSAASMLPSARSMSQSLATGRRSIGCRRSQTASLERRRRSGSAPAASFGREASLSQ